MQKAKGGRSPQTSDDPFHGTRFIVAAVCLMVCAVPLVFLRGMVEGDLLPKLFALHFCVSLGALGWLIHARWGHHGLVSAPPFLPALCFLGVALLSAAAAPVSLNTFVELTVQAALLVLLFVVASAVSLARLMPVLWAGAATGLAVAVIGILQYHNLAFLDLPSAALPSATFVNRNLTAEYLVCAIPLSGLLFLASQRWTALLLSGLSATLMGVCLVYTRSRAAWVGLLVPLLTAGVLLALSHGFRRRALEGVPGGHHKGRWALGFLLLFTALSPLPPRFEGAGARLGVKTGVASAVASVFHEEDAVYGASSRDERLTMWKATLRMVADHPLLGVGPGGWARAYPPYDGGATISPRNIPRWPHNDFLSIASEYGLIGLGVYLWFLWAGFRCILSMCEIPHPFARTAALTFAVSLLAILGAAMFGFPKERPPTAIFPYLLFGVAAATTGEREKEKGKRNPFLLLSGAQRSRRTPFSFLLPCLFLIVSLAATVVSWRRIAFDRHCFHAYLLNVSKKDWPALLAESRNALRYGAFRPDPFIFSGLALQNLGRYAEAEHAYREALARAPHDWYSRNGLSLVYLHEGRVEEAVANARSALVICPAYAEAHRSLGLALAQKGDLDGAVGEYRQAIRLKPDFVAAHNSLGLVLAKKGDLDGAIGEWRQAIRLKPDFVEACNNLGNALYTKEDLPGAIDAWRQALRINPEHPESCYNLGVALSEMGDRAGAVQALRACLRAEADGPVKQKARGLILQLGETP